MTFEQRLTELNQREIRLLQDRKAFLADLQADIAKRKPPTLAATVHQPVKRGWSPEARRAASIRRRKWWAIQRRDRGQSN